MFAGRCFRVRNRPRVFAIVRIRLLWPCRWGELEKVTFHGRVTCQFAPLFYCDLHKSGMSCKKGDAFRCTGAGFRESDTFASHLHWDLQFRSGVLEVLNRAVPLGFAFARWLEVSLEMLVLEACIVTFGESLVENARFGSLDCHFWWMSRGKCSFWKLALSLLVKVSWKMLVLEAWIATFGESLVENARFGSFHFW